jgi:hypothetical protein
MAVLHVLHARMVEAERRAIRGQPSQIVSKPDLAAVVIPQGIFHTAAMDLFPPIRVITENK